MADGLPPIQMDFNANGDPVVIVEEKQISNPAEILRTVPVLAEPNMVFAYAQLVNHLAHGDGFEIILDPDDAPMQEITPEEELILRKLIERLRR